MARRRRRRRTRVGLALFLAALLVLAGEVAVRLLGLTAPPEMVRTREVAFRWREMYSAAENPALSYRNTPGAQQKIASVTYTHDERGWRIPETGPVPTPEGEPLGVPRVAFLGDSTTYGFGVPATGCLTAQVAEQLGGRIVPLNLGVSGYGTEQEVELYADQRDQLGDASVVVLVLYPNDFSRAVFSWDAERGFLYYDPMPFSPGVRRALWNSALYQSLISWSTRESDTPEAFVEHTSEMAGRIRAAIARLRDMVSADGRELLVAHLPSLRKLDPYVFEEPVRLLEEICTELGVAHLDLLPTFLEERERAVAAIEARRGEPLDATAKRFYLARFWVAPKDHHLNTEGNLVAARRLAEELERLFGL